MVKPMLENFKVFGDESLGHIFMPEGLCYQDIKMIQISPVHGRAVALKIAEFEWISVKGGGWNYGGPRVYISKKDEELVFGLYPFVAAQRELLVSKALEKISKDFPKVLYYKKITEYDLPKEYDFLSTVQFKDGRLVDPCLLYTQVKSPYRVEDLVYLEKQKRCIIRNCCEFWGIDIPYFTTKFTQVLAKRVAIMHKNKFINDTLDWGNVTLLAEIIDYEWVTTPNLKLPDGTYGLELTDARKEKEILYGVEVVLQLKALLHEEYNFYDIYQQFIESYSEINKKFVDSSVTINKILKREKFVL